MCIILCYLLIADKVVYAKTIEFNRDVKNYQFKLQILNQQHQKITEFDTAIANDQDKRATGLMNVEDFDDNQAMLFIFDETKIVSMWMKNTKIPLDMIFIDENNKVVNIKHNAKPHSLKIISSQVPVKYVLEINAGLSHKRGINIGHTIKYEKIRH